MDKIEEINLDTTIETVYEQRFDYLEIEALALALNTGAFGFVRNDDICNYITRCEGLLRNHAKEKS